jgi:hypothetical protein
LGKRLCSTGFGLGNTVCGIDTIQNGIESLGRNYLPMTVNIFEGRFIPQETRNISFNAAPDCAGALRKAKKPPAP